LDGVEYDFDEAMAGRIAMHKSVSVSQFQCHTALKRAHKRA
jgi:hypothetical protein